MDEKKEKKIDIQKLTKLINDEDSIIELTKEPGWNNMLKKFSEFRIDAIDAVIAPGDTSMEKEHARAVGDIVNMLYNIGNTSYRDNLKNMKEGLERDIRITEELNEKGPDYMGLSNAI